MSDMIVAQAEVRKLAGRGPVDLLHFHQGQVLLVSPDAVGLYRSLAAVDDPLGNGVLGYESIPENLRPERDADGSVVAEQRAGCVRLSSGAVLFIRPDGVALYDDGMKALTNTGAHWLIRFS